MSFFKGYVKTRNKKSVDRFKNAPLRSLDEVEPLPEYAGILAHDAVLIDIDDEEQSEKLLDVIEKYNIRCQVRKTTRGMHFFFKNDGKWDKCFTGVSLACGIKADVKVGVKNAYSILKFGGEEREIVYDKLDDEVYQTPPNWLRIIKTDADLLDLAEGEGRNNALFKHILALQSAGLDRDECIEVLKVINENLFKEPLSDSEFETVTRPDAFTTEVSFFDDKGKFLFEKFAAHLIDKHHIKRVNGQLHVFENGQYVSCTRKLEKLMIEIIPSLSKRQRAETLAYIDVVCCENVEMADVKYIAFANGILDIETMEMLNFSPDIVITNKINWNFNPDAQNATVDAVLNKVSCNDPEIRALLEEATGYCFFRRNELRKSFVLTGGKSNGKSTYINMLGTMLGEENISALDLADLSSRFRTSELFGKLGNLGDDIGENFIDDMSIFKKLVSGDKVMVEYKGEKPFFFSNYAKFIFSANALPRVKDKTQAVLDRMIIIPFNATFSVNDSDFDPFISDKLKEKEAIEYLIKLGINALKRLLKTRKFTSSLKVLKELKEYNEENNPVLVFLEEIKEENLTFEPVGYWYSKYCDHCLAYGQNPISRIQFTKLVLKTLPHLEVKQRKINGEVVRFFVEKGNT